MSKKDTKSRVRLTVEQKQEIIIFYEKNPHWIQQELANKFNTSIDCWNNILTSKENILKNTNLHKKRESSLHKTALFDKELFTWFLRKRTLGFLICGDVHNRMAVGMAKKVGFGKFLAKTDG